LIYDPDLQVVDYSDLARQTSMITKVRLGSENCFLCLPDRARVATEYLDAASGAAGVSAASVQNINPGILECQDQLSFLLRLYRHLSIGRLGHNYVHQAISQVLYI
jgi:hypothetical protein